MVANDNLILGLMGSSSHLATLLRRIGKGPLQTGTDNVGGRALDGDNAEDQKNGSGL